MSGFKGQWANGGKGVKNRYLGLKFQINGKTQFGWARLTVKWSGPPFNFAATLTGYAYETIAGKSIIAGKTKGPDNDSTGDRVNPAVFRVPTPNPTSLGLLAIGAPGLSIWRREDSVAGVA
jgi:hypothetical protein